MILRLGQSQREFEQYHALLACEARSMAQYERIEELENALDTARQSRKRAGRLVDYYRLMMRTLNYDFGTVDAERKAALERVTELEMQRNIFGEQVEFDLLQGRTLTARCAEYVANAAFDVAGVAMEKVPAVPLGQALDELNQTAGELAESEDDDDIEEWQLDLARLEAVTAMFHAEQPDPCAAVRAELKAARQWARAWKAKAKQLRSKCNEWQTADEARSDCCIELDAADRWLAELRARVAELEAERDAALVGVDHWHARAEQAEKALTKYRDAEIEILSDGTSLSKLTQLKVDRLVTQPEVNNV